MKRGLEKDVVHATDEENPHESEIDISSVSLSAMLNPGDRPVAFRSRTLNPSERNTYTVLTEANAIIEEIKE